MGNAATSFALPLGYSGFARTVAWREGLESKSPQAKRQQQIPIQQLPRQMRTDVVRIPYFPIYEEVRHLLHVLPGWPLNQVTGLHRTLLSLGGTPRSAVDWRDPDKWIPARLDGGDLAVANAIWVESGGKVNPRHTFGHWSLCQKYGLLDEVGGTLRLTQRGRSFLEHEKGEV